LYSCVICHYDTVTVLVKGEPAPVHSSVAVVFAGAFPPVINAFELFEPPAPFEPFLLAVLKSVVSVQDVPFHSSVNADHRWEDMGYHLHKLKQDV
jgi:hypothetical protein